MEICLQHPVSLSQLQHLLQALNQKQSISLRLQGASNQASAEQSPIIDLPSAQQGLWLEARQACWTHPQLAKLSARVTGVWPELEWLWQVANWQAEPETYLFHAAPFWGLVGGLALSHSYGSMHPLASLQLQAGLCLPAQRVEQIQAHQLPAMAEIEPLVQVPLRERSGLWLSLEQQLSTDLQTIITKGALRHALTQSSSLALVCGYWQAKHPLPYAMACQRDWLLTRGLWQEAEPSRRAGQFIYPGLTVIPFTVIERMLYEPSTG